MSEIIYRQMLAEDAEQALVLRNEVFADAQITLGDWERDGVQVSIALLDGEVVGAIPLFERQLAISPNQVIRAPFENSVGTRAGLRSRGIGSGMIGAAREFLGGRADGLFVYRNHERSDGYRFYTRTNHYDLMYTRCYHLSHPNADIDDTEVLAGTEAICELASDLLPLFLSTYGSLGGFPRRHPGYWQRALSSSLFTEVPTDFYLIRHADPLSGYALVGIPRQEPQVQIMEMATRGGDLFLAAQVIARVASFAAKRHLPVEMEIAHDDPFIFALQGAGFEARTRETMLMGQLLDPVEFFRRYWLARTDLHGIGLQAVTEKRDYLFIQPHPGYPSLTLEMKEEALHRWLLGRINMETRLGEGTITTYGAHSDTVLQALCAAIPFTRWAYHRLDWL